MPHQALESKDFFSSYSYKKLAVLFCIAFLVRAATFYYYTQHNERYLQPDTMDYYNAAVCLYLGGGMTRVDTHEPLFWRTPGYPAYLLPFYKWYGVRNGIFQANTAAHKAALWVQIFLSSCTPFLVFFLALALVGSVSISWLLALIFALHPGFVLASGFLLTEALSALFFFLFLIFLYHGYCMWGEGKDTHTYRDLIIAAFALGVYTWMRPMGQFVGVVALLILALSSVSWSKKLKQCTLFGLIFFGLLAPWVVRNYNLTGHLFFWPGAGTYLACFNVPKIKRHLTGRPLVDCWKDTMIAASVVYEQEKHRMQKEDPGHQVCRELVASKLMWPWMFAFPLWAMQDWMQEVCKTTFDLYSHQLVSFAANSFKADPLEEILTEKIAACLYAQPMHLFMRFICWLEFLFSIFVWFGLIMGFFLFLMQSAWYQLRVPAYQRKMFFIWIKTGLVIGAVLCMTGGFGYARLRMPVEPLIVLLSLTWWYYMYQKEQYGKDTTR